MAVSMRRRRLFAQEADHTTHRTEPKVNWQGPGVYQETGETLTYVGKEIPKDATDKTVFRRLYTCPNLDS